MWEKIVDLGLPQVWVEEGPRSAKSRLESARLQRKSKSQLESESSQFPDAWLGAFPVDIHSYKLLDTEGTFVGPSVWVVADPPNLSLLVHQCTYIINQVMDYFIYVRKYFKC